MKNGIIKVSFKINPVPMCCLDINSLKNNKTHKLIAQELLENTGSSFTKVHIFHTKLRILDVLCVVV